MSSDKVRSIVLGIVLGVVAFLLVKTLLGL